MDKLKDLVPYAMAFFFISTLFKSYGYVYGGVPTPEPSPHDITSMTPILIIVGLAFYLLWARD
jgi:hypothetical protein